MTSGSVESITSGASTTRLIFFTSFSMNSPSSARSVVAMHTSMQCAPSSACILARSTRPSRSSPSTRRFAFLEPCVLSLSPIISGAGACLISTAFSAELTLGMNRIW